VVPVWCLCGACEVPILLNRFSKSSLAIRLFRALASAGALRCPLGCVRARRSGRLRSLKGFLEGIQEKLWAADRGAQCLGRRIRNHSVKGATGSRSAPSSPTPPAPGSRRGFCAWTGRAESFAGVRGLHPRTSGQSRRRRDYYLSPANR